MYNRRREIEIQYEYEYERTTALIPAWFTMRFQGEGIKLQNV